MTKNNFIPFGFSNGKETVEILEKYPELRELPHGSGINADYYLSEVEGIDQEKLIKIEGSYQYMNEDGFYVGWLDFWLYYYPKTNAFDHVRIKNDTMSDRTFYHESDGIKEYLNDLFGEIQSDVERYKEEKEIFQE